MSDKPSSSKYVLRAESGSFEVRGFAPTIVIHGREPSGDTVTKVQGPRTASTSRISPTGDISLMVQGTEGVGRSGETRVAKHLHAWMQQQGIQAEFLAGIDAAGEDRRLSMASLDLNAQIVTVPPTAQLWAEASRSSVTTSVPIDRAVAWIEQAIAMKVAKTTRRDREVMILILDAHHVNPLTEPGVVAAYLSQHGDPAQRHGFAGVCAVGSTSHYCARIGTCVF